MSVAHTDEELFAPEWTFGDRLRKFRRDLKLTQKDVASKLGVELARYSNWEAGISQPRDVVAIARRVQKVFKVRASWLLGLEANNGYLSPLGTADLDEDEFLQLSLHLPSLSAR